MPNLATNSIIWLIIETYRALNFLLNGPNFRKKRERVLFVFKNYRSYMILSKRKTPYLCCFLLEISSTWCIDSESSKPNHFSFYIFSFVLLKIKIQIVLLTYCSLFFLQDETNSSSKTTQNTVFKMNDLVTNENMSQQHNHHQQHQQQQQQQRNAKFYTTTKKK